MEIILKSDDLQYAPEEVHSWLAKLMGRKVCSGPCLDPSMSEAAKAELTTPQEVIDVKAKASKATKAKVSKAKVSKATKAELTESQVNVTTEPKAEPTENQVDVTAEPEAEPAVGAPTAKELRQYAIKLLDKEDGTNTLAGILKNLGIDTVGKCPDDKKAALLVAMTIEM